MQTFSFNPPINFVEKGKWLMGVTSFEARNSLSNITEENNSFSISTLGHWNSKSAQKTFGDLNKLLEIRSENDIELHTEQVRKKGLILIVDYFLSSLDPFNTEILEELKIVKYNVLEDMVYKMQLTYDELIDFLDLKYIPTKILGFSIPPGIYEVIDINFMLKHLFPKEVKVDISTDGIRLKSNLK